MTIKRTDAQDVDFQKLVKWLDRELAVRDGDDHDFYDQFNKIDSIKYAVVLYVDETPVACGAIKAYDGQTMEIKRMYTAEAYRGKGLATAVLTELIAWAQELGAHKCILETGIRQPEAIGLYEKNGFTAIPNYGQYADVADSRCFEKMV